MKKSHKFHNNEAMANTGGVGPPPMSMPSTGTGIPAFQTTTTKSVNTRCGSGTTFRISILDQTTLCFDISKKKIHLFLFLLLLLLRVLPRQSEAEAEAELLLLLLPFAEPRKDRRLPFERQLLRDYDPNHHSNYFFLFKGNNNNNINDSRCSLLIPSLHYDEE